MLRVGALAGCLLAAGWGGARLVRNALEATAASACAARLGRLAEAKSHWGNADYRQTSDEPGIEDLAPWLDPSHGPADRCPGGARYRIGPLDAPPACASGLPGHSLPSGDAGAGNSGGAPRSGAGDGAGPMS